MQCEEFEDRLNAVLDERRRPEWDAELRLHCETCRECREVAASYGALLDGFYTLCAGELPADLADRVLTDRAVLANRAWDHWYPQPATARRVAIAAAALATAAGLLIAFLPTPKTAPRKSSPEVAQSAAPGATIDAEAPRRPAEIAAASKTGMAAAEESGTAATERVRPSARPVVLPKWLAFMRKGKGDPYADLAKETGRGLASLVLLVPGVGGRGSNSNVSENAAEREPTWAGQMSEDLKPVTE